MEKPALDRLSSKGTHYKFNKAKSPVEVKSAQRPMSKKK